MTDTSILRVISEIEILAQEPYCMPCGFGCNYPGCKDNLTEHGKYCTDLKLRKIKKLCEGLNE